MSISVVGTSTTRFSGLMAWSSRRDAKEIRVPKNSARCGTLNGYESGLCQKCGLALSIEAAIKRDEEFREYKADVDAIYAAIGDSVDGKITV
jgi:hypothetical protein